MLILKQIRSLDDWARVVPRIFFRGREVCEVQIGD